MPEFNNVFQEIVFILFLAALVGIVALKLRQPLIVAFIALGLLVGPSGLGLVTATDQIHLFAELGLALLLFVVGLRLDVRMIREMGLVALATGMGQVVFTSALGYIICIALGLSPVPALYVAIALTFSSTIIIVKMLSDRRETDSLHGRLAVGLLIVQDLVVIVTMIVLSGFAGRYGGSLAMEILIFLGKGALFLFGLGLLMTYVLPWLLDKIARSPELLVLFAIAWAIALADVSDILGFSKEVGAFLAGVSLASTAYREIIGARLVSLRDFLLLFFFVELGSRLDLGIMGGQVLAAIPLSLFVLIGNPLIMMVITGFMGYRKRTSFLSGVLIAQISEFSLILVNLGFALGHIDDEIVGLVTLVGLVTIAVSTYMIRFSHQLYDRLAPYLGIFERREPFREYMGPGHGIVGQADIIMYGTGRYGTNIARNLIAQGRTVLGIDFDPQAVRRWNGRGWLAWFGDAEDPEFPSALPLGNVRWVISSIRDLSINKTLLHSLRSHGYTGNIAVTAHTTSEADELTKLGADVVFVPYDDAASQAVRMLNVAEKQEARRKMDKVIAALKDHYIICGYGRMGQQIARDFESAGVPFVVIEWNPEQIPKLVEHGVPYIEGKATEDETLIKAGIDRAKGLVAVTATDEENVFIVLTARGLNPNLYIVARSIQMDNEDKLKRAGADKVMSPYVLGGHRMAAAMLKPRVMDFLDVVMHGDGGLEVGDIVVSESAPFVGKTLLDSEIKEKTGVTILAVRRDAEQLHANPSPDWEIRPGDELIILGTCDQIDALERLAAGKA